jgi:hypothetical protein
MLRWSLPAESLEIPPMGSIANAPPEEKLEPSIAERRALIERVGE